MSVTLTDEQARLLRAAIANILPGLSMYDEDSRRVLSESITLLCRTAAPAGPPAGAAAPEGGDPPRGDVQDRQHATGDAGSGKDPRPLESVDEKIVHGQSVPDIGVRRQGGLEGGSLVERRQAWGQRGDDHEYSGAVGASACVDGPPMAMGGPYELATGALADEIVAHRGSPGATVPERGGSSGAAPTPQTLDQRRIRRMPDTAQGSATGSHPDTENLTAAQIVARERLLTPGANVVARQVSLNSRQVEAGETFLWGREPQNGDGSGDSCYKVFRELLGNKREVTTHVSFPEDAAAIAAALNLRSIEVAREAAREALKRKAKAAPRKTSARKLMSLEG